MFLFGDGRAKLDLPLVISIYSPVVGRSSFVDGRVSLGTQACDEDTIPPFPQPA